MVDAWNSYMTGSNPDLEEFLKACINSLTERDDFLTDVPTTEVDIKRRNELYLRYGVEV